MAESEDWPLRPFDPKGSNRVPVDEIIVGQIRCIITEWNPHDWSTARAILTAEITGLIDKLPTLTVRDIGQLFHGIANRGRGQRHTASTSIISLQFPAGWTLGQPTTVQPESAPGLDKTAGYLGGEALADAMGVHPTRLPEEVPTPPMVQVVPNKPKRSTERNEGQTKLSSCLTAHHKYAQGDDFNSDPIGSNALAVQARVSKSTASNFFKKYFGSHLKYRRACASEWHFKDTLKRLNQEYTPRRRFGGVPPDNGKRDREDDD